MSKKRSAITDLNQDNWNNEDEPEEMGIYRRASPTSLKMRPIKRAKRRGLAGDGEEPAIFKNFKGFGTTDSSSTTPTFSFFSNDAEKPKLSIGSFPSFSFNKSSEANTNDENKKGDSLDNSKTSEKETLVFSSTATTAEKNLNKSKNETEPCKPAFKFGLSGAGKNSPSNSIESSPKPIFSFGVTDSNKNSEKSLLSNFNFNPSKPIGDASPKFKFGINSGDNNVNNNASSSTASQQSKSSNNKNCENSSDYQDTKNKESESSKFNGIKGNSGTEKTSTLFLANLKALNLGVMKWIQQHLDKNQYINLIPIFEDYKSHFEDIKKKFNYDDSPTTKTSKLESSVSSSSNKVEDKPSGASSMFSFGSSSASGNKSELFSFGTKVGSTSEPKTVDNSNGNTKKLLGEKPFTFGVSNSESEKSSKSETANKSGLVFNFDKTNSNSKNTTLFGSDNNNGKSFSFGSADNSDSSKSTEFTFGSSKDIKSSGFSFGTTEVKPSEESKPNDNEEEQNEEQLPEIKEDDALYEKKVKLFHKKDGKYLTIGLGTLYIKPVKENEKSQLLVRADNKLGTVLLNIILNDNIPTQRVGKNNVLIVCVPNPPIRGATPQVPASILIRVKTGDDADQLLDKLNQYKKSSACDDDSGKESV